MLRFLPFLSVPSHQSLGRIVSSPTICGSSRLPGPSKVKVISRSPVFSDLDDVPVIGGELRAVFLRSVERENHVVRRDRTAVMPFRFARAADRGRGKIVRIAHRFGDEPIFARHFIERVREQRVVDQRDSAGEIAFDAGHDHVEAVEGADGDLPRRAALRGVGVDVIELLESWRIFQVAVERSAVPPGV